MIPKENDYLWGHQEEYFLFKQAVAQHRLHHAWLISGSEGIGKTTFTYHLVRLLLGTNRTAIQRIKAGSHADLLTVARREDEKKQRLRAEILLDDIKMVGEFLRLTPAEGGWRVVVIEEAELMNRNAANSLLKVLEEPPNQAILFLISSHPGKLLPTIRSRCRKLPLKALNFEEMQQGIKILAPTLSQEHQEEIISLAHGSLGQALKLLQKDSVKLKEIVDNLLENKIKAIAVYQNVDAVLKYEKGFSLFLNLLSDAISNKIRQAVRKKQSSFGQPLKSIQQWIEIWQQLLQWHDETERFNLDKRQTLISEFNLISEI